MGGKRQEREETSELVRNTPFSATVVYVCQISTNYDCIARGKRKLFSQAINRYSLHSKDINIQTRLDNNRSNKYDTNFVSLIFTAVIATCINNSLDENSECL